MFRYKGKWVAPGGHGKPCAPYNSPGIGAAEGEFLWRNPFPNGCGNPVVQTANTELNLKKDAPVVEGRFFKNDLESQDGERYITDVLWRWQNETERHFLATDPSFKDRKCIMRAWHPEARKGYVFIQKLPDAKKETTFDVLDIGGYPFCSDQMWGNSAGTNFDGWPDKDHMDPDPRKNNTMKMHSVVTFWDSRLQKEVQWNAEKISDDPIYGDILD